MKKKQLIFNEDTGKYELDEKTPKALLPECLTNVKQMLNQNRREENNIYSPSGDVRNTKFLKDKQLLEDFEKIWAIYPRKEGKSKAFTKYKLWLKGKKVLNETVKLTNKQMWYAVMKYADESKEKEKTFIKMGSTFFADAILDYVEDLEVKSE